MSSDTGSEDSFQVVERMNPEERDSKMEGDSPVKTSPLGFPQAPQPPSSHLHASQADLSLPQQASPEAKHTASEQKLPAAEVGSPHASQSAGGSVDVNLSHSSGHHSLRGGETSSAPPDVSYYRQDLSEFGSPSEHSEPSGLARNTGQAPEQSPDASALFQAIDAPQSFPQAPYAAEQQAYQAPSGPPTDNALQEQFHTVGGSSGPPIGGQSSPEGYLSSDVVIEGQAGSAPPELSSDLFGAQPMGGGDSVEQLFPPSAAPEQPSGDSGSAELMFSASVAQEQASQSEVQAPEDGFADFSEPGFEATGQTAVAPSSGDYPVEQQHTGGGLDQGSYYPQEVGYGAVPDYTANPYQAEQQYSQVQQPWATSSGDMPHQELEAESYKEGRVESTGTSPGLNTDSAPTEPPVTANSFPYRESASSFPANTEDSQLMPHDAEAYQPPPSVETEHKQAHTNAPELQVTEVDPSGMQTSPASFTQGPGAEQHGSPGEVPGFENLHIDTDPKVEGHGASPVPPAANLFGSSSAVSGSPHASRVSTPRSGGTPTAATLFASSSKEEENAGAFQHAAPAESLFGSDRARQKSVSSAASDFFDGIDESNKIGGEHQQEQQQNWQAAQPTLPQPQEYAFHPDNSWQEYAPPQEGAAPTITPAPQADFIQSQTQSAVYTAPAEAYAPPTDPNAYLGSTDASGGYAQSAQVGETGFQTSQQEEWQGNPMDFPPPSSMNTGEQMGPMPPAFESGNAAGHGFNAEEVGSKSPVEYGIEFAAHVPTAPTQVPSTFSAAPDPMHPLPPIARPPPTDGSLFGERRNDGKPPHAVVSWGFGGRLLVMVPQQRMKLQPTLVTRGSMDGSSDSLSVPRRESVGSIADSAGSEGGRRKLRKGQVRMLSLRTLVAPEATEITAFPGPLCGPKSAPAEVDMFVEGKLHYAEGLNDGELQGSTRLLWYVLKQYIRGAGDLQREDIVRDIVDVLREGEVNKAEVESVVGEGINSADIGIARAHIQELLLSGDREGAVVHAVENELWAEALVISNFVSASAYRKVVARFANKSLGGFKATRTVFHLYAGRGDELVSQQSMDKEELRSSWRQVLACIMSNRTPGDTTALQLLGDRLWLEFGSVSAAHVCYLLAGVPVHGSGRSRIVLVGGDHKSCFSQKLCVVPAAIQMTEIYLYARQLGDPQYYLAAFQGYRLVYAMWLADLGYTEEALKWVESIQEAVDMCVKRVQEPGRLGIGSGFQRQLKIFGDRLKFVGNGYPGSRKQMEPGETPSFIGKFARFFGQAEPQGATNASARGSPESQPTPLQFTPSHTDPFAKPFTRPVRTDNEPEPPRERQPMPSTFAPPPMQREGLVSTADGMSNAASVGGGGAGGAESTSGPPHFAQPASTMGTPMPPPMHAANRDEASAKEGETDESSKKKDEKEKKKESDGGSGGGGSVRTSLFQGLKTITQKIYKPKGHVVDSGMGSEMKAVYDPVKGQWIFPDDPGMSKEEKLKQEQKKAGPPVMAKAPAAALNPAGRPSTAPPVGGNQFRIMPPAGRGKSRRDLSKIRYVDPFKAMKQGKS